MERLKACIRKHGQGEDKRLLGAGRSFEGHKPRRHWPFTLKRCPFDITSSDHNRSSIATSMLELLKGPFVKQRHPDPSVNTTGKCHLLELPTELRCAIYELVYTGTAVELAASTRTPGLLLTCQQIRAEAEPMYWGLSNFRSWKLLEIRDFLTRVGARNLERIKSVTWEEYAAPQPSRHDRTRGIAWSAFMAQWKLFFMANWLREGGVVVPENVNFQASFITVDRELEISDKPWDTFGRLLENAVVRSGGGQDLGPSELTSAERDGLRRMVAGQSRFFGYEHSDSAKCWSSEWCVLPGYRCGCPAKTVV